MNEKRKRNSRSRSRQNKSKHYLYHNKSAIRQQQKQKKQQQQRKQQQKKQLQLQQQQQHGSSYQQQQELIRSLLRIEQNRQKPFDKFIRIIWIYKGKLLYDAKISPIMQNAKKYLNSISNDRLKQMLNLAQGQYKMQKDSQWCSYWQNLIILIKYKLRKIHNKDDEIKLEYKQKINEMLRNKTQQQLLRLYETLKTNLQNLNIDMDYSYWQQIIKKIECKISQYKLQKYYNQFKQKHKEIKEIKKQKQQFENTLIQPQLQKNIIEKIKYLSIQTQQNETQQRIKLSQKIFKQEFEKYRQLLDLNLSLPKNHNLLLSEIITDQTNTYDFISKQIIQFEKYKRIQNDQQIFKQEVEIQTQGRFRDRKPQYLNKVRVCQDYKLRWKSAIINNHTNKQIKIIQGYKFNIFYPDLYDKYKTPQYYLQNTQNPDYCLIKFKAGPPYKDIAFRILKKQWDFSKKSGFQSIFSKGILQLYFNIKKPRYRI